MDILFYDDAQVDEAGLQIPHPQMRGAAFVLVPLADLIPAFIHPILGKRWAACSRRNQRRRSVAV